MTVTTYADAVQHVLDYLGGGPSDAVLRDCRRAVLEAYRDLANAHTWSYLYNHGRIITSPPYMAGTITYDATGGQYDRLVTLAGGAWPDWAAMGYLRVGRVAYRVAERKSATTLTLTETLAPAEDLPAGTAYTLYRDTYLLPADFIAQDQALYESNFSGMTYCHPREWLFENRYLLVEGIPRHYTVTGDPSLPGRLVIRIFPWPTTEATIDFLYKRRPRPLAISEINAGTVSLSAGTAGVTGTASVFSPAMVGSLLRVSATKAPPTGPVGGSVPYNPAAFESIIAAWVSPTQIVTSDVPNNALSGVAYTISDPVDIESGSMTNAFLRCCEMHVGMSRTLKDKPSARLQYRAALEEAQCADSRSFAGRRAGPRPHYRIPLRDMPTGPDNS